jgi:uncharacterized protein YjbJ (UPF0337 family)
MDNKQFKDQWTAMYPKIKQKWSKFTDQELKQINGEKSKFLHHLQQKYGVDKEDAELELNRLVTSGSRTDNTRSNPTLGAGNPKDKKFYK